MGAETFYTKGRGRTIDEAFAQAIAGAQYAYGHRGYTGTIAEKRAFVEVAPQDFEMLCQRAVAQAGAGSSREDVDRAVAYFARSQFAVGEAQVRLVAAGLIQLGEFMDKWGPAGAFNLVAPTDEREGEWLFFGWAAS